MMPVGTPTSATREDGRSYERQVRSSVVPGIIVVYTAGQPTFEPVPLRNAGLRLGRRIGDVTFEDDLLSRAHAEVVYTGRDWIVRDLGSRNGTFVDGARLPNEPANAEPQVLRGLTSQAVVRIGHSLIVLCDDVAALLGKQIVVEQDTVCGPRWHAALEAVSQAGQALGSVHITGPSGCGKERAARHFHNTSARNRGPFIAVNCAEIPESIAERVLFGAVKGAFSDADSDATGYVAAATGGTLFLDEIAELRPSVQAKLLRVLETKRVVPLGATKATAVDIQLCSATNRNLREAVANDEFREDLYFRIGQPEVCMPALCERREEIPFLVQMELAKRSPKAVAHALFVETCLIRQWPGNVRELRAAVAAAGLRASSLGESVVQAHMMPPAMSVANDAHQGGHTAKRSVRSRSTAPNADELRALLRREGWNVTATARLLGIHRTQLRRWIQRLGIAEPSDR